jgi:thiol-disulfide isomerase/thioredoxin
MHVRIIMHKLLAALLALMLLGASWAPAAQDPGKIKKGEAFPSLILPAPEDAGQRAYLGLKAGQGLDLAQVKAPLLIVEFLNIYCPHCQRQAPRVNALYRLIQEKGWGGKIKILGVAASNTGEEVGDYVGYYKVPFPVVPDYKLRCVKVLGQVYTPYFVVIQRLKGGGNRVLYAASGALPPHEEFLGELAAQAGLR